MTFKDFSQAARLYAENWAVVEAMKSAFDRSVGEFLDALGHEIERLLNGRQLQSKTTSSYHYWWLGNEGVDRDVYPQLWIDTRVADIVFPGKLRVTATAPRATEEGLKLLSQAPRDTRIANFCSPGKGGPWSLFEAQITYEQDNAVQTAAQKLADMLVVLDSLRLEQS